ncbi:MAG TPA: hypothetical protein VMN79_14130 [Casimicrobiaceae bacterium]|nr:hypothetical protein [Casimicrobiaceae bacterium]
MIWWVRLALATGGALLLVASLGCGSSPTANRADFISQADTICKSYGVRGERILSRLQKRVETVKSSKELYSLEAEEGAQLAHLLRRETRDLAMLKAPPDAALRWRHALAQLRVEAEELQAFARASRRLAEGLPSSPAAKPSGPDAVSRKFFNIYGFKVCGGTQAAPTSG